MTCILSRAVLPLPTMRFDRIRLMALAYHMPQFFSFFSSRQENDARLLWPVWDPLQIGGGTVPRCRQRHANKVSPRAAQALMRHTDPRLTASVYTDEKFLPSAAELMSVPKIRIA